VKPKLNQVNLSKEALAELVQFQQARIKALEEQTKMLKATSITYDINTLIDAQIETMNFINSKLYKNG